ncbi:MAG: integrase [Bradyrhizobium sp.]|uniref:site-specific integrase n=1 Tax=Bradyrhizobium sp. TaxID=376 RepID=UPI00122015C8|nr:MAG: integrase [Bradyrhizobium sp.]
MTFLTPDNPHLSELTIDPLIPAQFAVNCKQAQEGVDQDVTEEVRRLVQAATSPNTRRAYRSDLAHFLANGGKLPATAVDVAVYLARFGGKLAIATLARRLVAIGRAHTCQDLTNPCQSEPVRLTFRGIRRTYGRPQRQAKALTKEDICAVVASLGDSLSDLRDRALILLGFHGAFRRSELCAVDCKSIAWSDRGMVITIRKSKTDQERKGRDIAMPRGRGICPVEALQRWLETSGINEGTVFRSIDRAGRISNAALSGDAVGVILKRRLRQVGCDPSDYSGHSLRAGFVTEAVNAGIPTWKIRRQTGHSSDTMLDRYIRRAEPF